MTRRRRRPFPPSRADRRRGALRLAATLALAVAATGTAAWVFPWQGLPLSAGPSAAQADDKDDKDDKAQAKEKAKEAAEARRQARAELASQAARRSARARTPAEIPVFARSQFQSLVAEIADAFSDGRVVEGDAALQRTLARWPHMHGLRVALAQLRVRQERLEDAEAALQAAADSGYRNVAAIEMAPIFAKLRGRPGFASALEAMRAPPPESAAPPPPAIPSPLEEGKAVISEANSEWSPSDGVARAMFVLPPPNPDLPVMWGDSPEARLLSRLLSAGLAAGNHGDFYENLDDNHSGIGFVVYPQITHLEHAPEVRAQGYGYGLADGIAISANSELYPPVFGNSSTAMTSAPAWRSMARLGLTRKGGPQELWRQYASNQIYIYPEHKDHDGFYGDVFPANTPYLIVSQGSSGSDGAAKHAVAKILAALRPDTKAALIEQRMISPVVQMIWRRGQKGIETDEDYLSAAAHPTVFDPEMAEPIRMIEIANALTPDQIPPLVTLKVLDENRPVPGVSVFGDGLSQGWFDTPSAISRLFRDVGRTMSMRVGASERNGHRGRPASFRWVLLRGDPDRVRITPSGEHGETADIEVDWQSEVAAPPRGLRSHRVDIAVFAEVEGAALSAPAFISVAFPPRQERTYDAAGRPKTISYDSAETQAEYADPWLWPARGWRDLYLYDAQGRPDGWRRGPTDGYASERYTRHGAAVIESDARDRPVRARIMGYPLVPTPKGPSEVQRIGGDQLLVYSYDGPDDMIGYATPTTAPASAKPLRNPTR
ncbi:hypothetical protein [uncultured Albimonas sp.]|uniref:hypothetical protein n=1 Tax=uncultured Albimonas sp. TaxID=1331701 RepID=UPI0030EF69B3